jgi:sulfur-carrier protein
VSEHPDTTPATTPGGALRTVRVTLPAHLRTLAKVDGELALMVADPVTIPRLLDALEAEHPVLRGTIRDHATHERRAFVRFYAGGRDHSHDPPDTELPAAVVDGTERFAVVGAMAGG